MSLDYESPYYDAEDEARTATRHAPEDPPRGSLAEAIERGYDPRDEFEEQP